MKELEQLTADETVENTELDTLADERENNATYKWLTDKLKATMFDSINKAAKGIEVDKHNAFVVKLAGILKGYSEDKDNPIEVNVGDIFTGRKTKRGQAFYGYNTDLYNAVKGSGTDGLPSL